jgi:CheY-like chemotaxis protein
VVVLQKPFTVEQLVQSLNVVTGKAVAVKSSVSVAGLTASLTGLGAPRPPRRTDLSTLRVLIVDDSTTARVHERTVLQGLGLTRFAESADGAQAIAAATREAFDLIVTDYNMPLMDGYALVSYLKQTPATKTIPIIMVTTETSPAILDPVRALGVAAVLPKAFEPAAVKDVIDKLFG